MALKDTWIDKVDGVDEILAKDINEIAHSVIEVEENSFVEVDPLYIRKAGTYKIHAVRENTGVVSIEVYVLDEGGIENTNLDNRILDFVWSDESLEADFTIELENDVEHGLYIKTKQGVSLTVYATVDAGIEALKKENEERLTDYVKNTDYCSADKAGLARTNNSYGIYGNPTDGALSIVAAEEHIINAKASNYLPIVPKYLDYAVKVGITTNKETLTEDEKAAALEWLGAVKKLTTTSGVQVYGRISGEERAITTTQDKTAATLAYRGSTGTFKVGEPTDNAHPATKKYVDENKGTKLYLHTLSNGAEGFKIISTSADPMTWKEDPDGNGFATPIYTMLAAYYFNPTVTTHLELLKVSKSCVDATIHIILAGQTSLTLTSDMTDVVTEL